MPEVRGRAKVLHTGELCIRNAAEGATFARTTQLLYSDDSAAVSKAQATPDMSVKHTELVVMSQCEWDSPTDKPEVKNTSKAETRGAPMAVPVMPAQNIPSDVTQPQI